MPPKKGHASKPTGSKAKILSIEEEGSHIIFEDDKKKGKKGGKTKEQPSEEPVGPPKPTVKQIIGGASWTGKLPLNLLSEHCQRQKWNTPEYSMRQMPGRDGHEKMYRSEVTLSRKEPKTGEIIKLPTFRTPEILKTASEEPTALEARHFAGAYALFRVSSMKNLSMALPPKYRDFWKGEFQQVKKEDEKEGRGWMYDADPFAAEQKKKEIHQAMDKRQAEQEKKKEAIAKNPALALQQMPRGRDWERAPKIEMGPKIRADVERLVRQSALWNPYEIRPSERDRKNITDVLTRRGFRRIHVEEALQYCRDEEEALEWLLIHVPEDDLPAFALPANYSAGISLASGDIVLEAKLKRLAVAGYPKDMIMQALKDSNGSEHKAAFWLQSSLQNTSEGSLNDDIESSLEWDNETMALEAIYSDRYQQSANECSVALELGDNLSATVRFIISEYGYPYELPGILIASNQMPAYVRLSATKQALQFAETNFKSEPMIYNICEWLEGNFLNIIDHPMSLTDLHLTENRSKPTLAGEPTHESKVPLQMRLKRRHVDRRTEQDILTSWQERQATPQQRKMINVRTALPAWNKKDEILQCVLQNQVTIITGETGSGKSTQVVQFVLDQAIQETKASSTRILCTQPRRVAALSLADRVSNERCSEIGNEVGYIIRGESRMTSSTKITFMTTGVLLRQIQSSGSLKDALHGVSHVFIDEVHERSLDTDFLLALLKDSLKIHPTLKVVLMSATLDKDIFMSYFDGIGRVAHVHIEGRTYPVQDIYLEEVLQTTRFVSGSDADLEMPIGKAIASLGAGINYDLIKALVAQIDQELDSLSGAILIFLPGTLEIDRCIRALASISKVISFPLHASLLPSEQKKVFPPAPSGRRKVIAATNVAETSITIEDIVAVIDTGRVKETNYDVTNNIVRLEEVWASQAACKQRRGRAGRVRAGKCYKLFTNHVEWKMAPKPLPEIRRVPLEQLCLSVKASGSDRNVSQFLGSLITPPKQGAIDNAISTLHFIGALEAGRLTALGTHLSLIPADLRCAKLLVYGALFNCLEPCLTISSILTVKDPFVSPRDKREEADAAKATFPTQNGDLMLSLAAYDEYSQLSQDMRYKQLQAWCGEKYLSPTTLRDITSTRSQLLDSLKDAGLVSLGYRSRKGLSTEYSPLLLRALISAALQPQIAEIRFPEKKYIQSLTGAKELDPEARTIKYFIPPSSTIEGPETGSSSATTPQNSRPQTPQPLSTSSAPSNSTIVQPSDKAWQRVFIHPSSPLFHNTPSTFTTGQSSASYLSYFSKMATGSGLTPKTYISALTPLNSYTQLLFGAGGVRIDTTVPGGGLLVTENFKVRGWARIGVLVSRLRTLLDEELRRAIDQPASTTEEMGSRFEKSEVVRLVKWLVELNGQDR